MLISCTGVALSFGGRAVLENVDLALEPGRRVALIGPNGAGKTTLLSLLAGERAPDAGEIARAAGIRIGYLRQNGGLTRGQTIDGEMRAALGEVFAIQRALLETGEKMAAEPDHAGEEYRALEQRYQALEARFTACDGYGAEVRINTVLNALGFGGFDRATPVETLSGGEQTRLMLCRLLLESPDLLILDEATNHLDFHMLDWLEHYLLNYKGALLTVSHDRWFLDRVTQETWEIEERRVVCYPAPYNRYLTLRKERIDRLQKEFERREAERARLLDFAERNMARASTSAMAKSRLKMAERLGGGAAPPPETRPPLIRFTPRQRPVSDVLVVENLSLWAGEREKLLVDRLDLHVKRGERLAVVGENGAGKSTLLRALVRAEAPNVRWGRNTRVSLFEQGAEDLHPDKTAIMELWDRFPAENRLSLQTLLGGLGLTGEAAFKRIEMLSGGERARVKLALLALEHGNVLLLDEPTNHLDIPSKEALEEALLAFEGTLVVVSHDRWLLSRLPNRILRLENGRAELFDGGFEAMMEQLSARTQPRPPAVPKAGEGSQEFHRGKAQRSAEAAARRRIAELEAEIDGCERELAEARGLLEAPDDACDYQRLCALGEQAAALEERLRALYAEWHRLV